MRHVLVLLTLAALVPPLAAQPPKKGEDPIIAEFKKHIGSLDSAVRRDQVERLAKVSTPESVQLLLTKGLTDDESLVKEKAVWALSQMEGADARGALLAGLDHAKPEIREGAAAAVGAIKDWESKPIEKLVALLLDDRSPFVRAAAAESLGMLGDQAAVSGLVRSLAAKEDGVVIAAADSLSLLRAPGAASALLTLLDHPAWRVQLAGLNGLASCRAKEAVDPVIKYLREAEGRPREVARRTLIAITKRSFGMNPDQWQEWWNRVKATWTLPPDTEKDPEDDAPPAGYGRKPTTYHRIQTYSQRVIFVIDISTSMETRILLRQGRQVEGADAARGAARKIDVAREELAFALRGMDPETKFNIIAFETDIRFWQKEPVTASPANVQAALRWIQNQNARKPSTVGGVTSSGVGPDGMMAGRTNTYDALRAVYGLPPRKATGAPTGGVTSGGRPSGPKPYWDTCFFLSDGAPTEGAITDVDDLLKEVERWNKSAKMVIHTIGMEESIGLTTLLQGIARLTGGRCVFVGR